MAVTGSCHCGAISYSLDEAMPTTAMACNCSICRRRGYLMHFTTPDKFTLNTAEGAVADYTFNTHNIHHSFCGICGCAPHGTGTGPDGTKAVVINLRCADGIDPASLTIHHHDGAKA